jgi:hypothetical protein
LQDISLVQEPGWAHRSGDLWQSRDEDLAVLFAEYFLGHFLDFQAYRRLQVRRSCLGTIPVTAALQAAPYGHQLAAAAVAASGNPEPAASVYLLVACSVSFLLEILLFSFLFFLHA